jgi:hypothetical protein
LLRVVWIAVLHSVVSQLVRMNQRRLGAGSLIGRPQVARRLRFLRSPFKPDVRISRIRLTDGLLMRHARLQGSQSLPMPPAERHSARSGHTAHGNDAPDCTWPRCTAGAGVFARYQWGVWVWRPCPCAYLPTPTRPKQGPFPRPSFSPGVSSTMNPSDSRPARFPFAVGL